MSAAVTSPMTVKLAFDEGASRASEWLNREPHITADRNQWRKICFINFVVDAETHANFWELEKAWKAGFDLLAAPAPGMPPSEYEQATNTTDTIKAPSNPLNYRRGRFNTELLGQGLSPLVGALQSLEDSYQTAYSISCLSSLLNADDLERDNIDDGGQPLDLYLRGGLTAAIQQLASSLHSSLCWRADSLQKMLETERQAGA